jgi:leucyl-tRNA synthetase
VNGKVRDKITVPADASEETIFTEARQAKGVQAWLDGKQIKKRIYVPRKLVSFVV